ncbi:hypothetical protein CCP4SC76_5740007 [Gammaproteobacteria bacterium]
MHAFLPSGGTSSTREAYGRNFRSSEIFVNRPNLITDLRTHNLDSPGPGERSLIWQYLPWGQPGDIKPFSGAGLTLR